MILAFDYSKLRGKIKEVFGTQDKFAKALGISGATLSLKLNNISEFTQQEMAARSRGRSLSRHLLCLTRTLTLWRQHSLRARMTMCRRLTAWM